MRITVLIILAFITQGAFSQKPQHNRGFMEGYVVKINNDTLFGEVKFRDEDERMLNKIRYRESKDASIQSLHPREIKAFRLGKYYYRVWNEHYLQEVSFGNKVDVFENRSHKYTSMPVGNPTSMGSWGSSSVTVRDEEEKSEIYMFKKNGSVLAYESTRKLIDKKLKARLIDFFKDEPNLVSKIQESYYTRADILYMAYEYNDPAKYQLKVINKEQYEKEKRKRGR